jgi:hypothetical protein
MGASWKQLKLSTSSNVKVSILLAIEPEACMMACPQSAEYLQAKAPFPAADV